MPLVPYDPSADDPEDAEIYDIDGLIERILHDRDDFTSPLRSTP